MKKLPFLLGFLLLSAGLFAQQSLLVFLEASEKKPFYVKIGNKTTASSGSGQVYLTDLSGNNFELFIGFPETDLPEYRFQVSLGKNDNSFQLKQAGAAATPGWVLIDLESNKVIQPGVVTTKTASFQGGVRKTDAFSIMMAGVVNDTSVLYTSVIVPSPAEQTKTVASDPVSGTAPAVVAASDAGKTAGADRLAQTGQLDSARKKQEDSTALTAQATASVREASGLEKERKDSVDKAAIAQNEASKLQATNDSISKAGIVKEGALMDAVAKEAAAKDAVAKDAAAKDAVVKDSIAKAAAAPDLAARDAKAKDDAANEIAARELAAKEAAAKDLAAKDAALKESTAKEAAEKDLAAKEAIAKDNAARDAAIKDSVAKDVASKEAAYKDSLAKAKAAKDSLAAEVAVKDQAAKEQANKDQAAKDQAAKDKAANDQAAKDQAARDAVAKEQAVKDQAARDQVAKDVAAKDAAAGSTVTRISERKGGKEWVALYSVKNNDGKTDTIQVVIPVDSPSVSQPRKDSIFPRWQSNPRPLTDPVVPKKDSVNGTSNAGTAGTYTTRNGEASNSNPGVGASPGSTTGKDTSSTKNITGADRQKEVAAGGKGPVMINSDCVNFATEYDLDKLRVKMIAEVTADDRIAAARKVFRTKCFTTRQIRALTELFLNDEGKYKFLDAAYPFVSDSQEFRNLAGVLKEDYYIKRFNAMIRL